MTPHDKLYTFKDVYEMFGFNSKDLSQSDFAEAVRESRCYRKIGTAERMTDLDVINFMAWCSPRRTSGGTPADHEAGQVVVICDPFERDGLVYVGWSAVGQELSLLDTVREGCPDDVGVHAMWPATYGEYRELTETWVRQKKRYGKRGKWFLSSIKEDIRERLDEREEET